MNIVIKKISGTEKTISSVMGVEPTNASVVVKFMVPNKA